MMNDKMNGINLADKITTLLGFVFQPIYSRRTFFWEIGSIETVMTDGVQRAVFCEFVVRSPPDNSSKSSSTWKLALDLEDDEPAITVHKVSPLDKLIYFRLAIQVMKNSSEGTDVINHPHAKLFYDSSEFTGIPAPGKETRKFSLHKQLDYGSSYTTWLKDVLIEGSLLLKVEFETCESVSY